MLAVRLHGSALRVDRRSRLRRCPRRYPAEVKRLPGSCGSDPQLQHARIPPGRRLACRQRQLVDRQGSSPGADGARRCRSQRRSARRGAAEEAKEAAIRRKAGHGCGRGCGSGLPDAAASLHARNELARRRRAATAGRGWRIRAAPTGIQAAPTTPSARASLDAPTSGVAAREADSTTPQRRRRLRGIAPRLRASAAALASSAFLLVLLLVAATLLAFTARASLPPKPLRSSTVERGRDRRDRPRSLWFHTSQLGACTVAADRAPTLSFAPA